MTNQVALYSAVGDEITHYIVDVDGAALIKRESIRVPANVQYAWPHPSRQFLYVATSNRGSDPKADHNHLCALRIDPATGALSAHGETRALPQRAVHICVDAAGGHVLSAHNLASGITVHRISDDGTLGEAVAQPNGLDYGIYPHQVRVMPCDRSVILVDRGNATTADKAEDPGALRVFGFDQGVFSPAAVVAPDGGYGFGPRHLDFHPRLPWVYVSLEIQSKLYVYRMTADGVGLEAEAAYRLDMLAERANVKPRQLGGTVHVHPNGRFVYLANRADSTAEYQGTQVFAGGENNIAVFAIDQESGAPKLIQHADTRSIHVRTFALDPGGRLLVTASIKPLAIRDGARVAMVPAALSVFRVANDGKLGFVRKYDVATDGKMHYWMGMVALP